MPRESSHFDEGLEKAHQALLEIMDRVGALIQRGETDGSVWRQVLHALHKRVWDHFEFEERNGYLETVLQREPGLRHRVEELLRQHDELRRGLSDLIHRLPGGSRAGLSRPNSALARQVAPA